LVFCYCNVYPSDGRLPIFFLNEIDEFGLAKNDTFLLSELPKPAKLVLRFTLFSVSSAFGLLSSGFVPSSVYKQHKWREIKWVRKRTLITAVQYI